MKCEIIQDLLPLYVDEICSSVTAEAIREHLHTCEECRKREKELRTEFIVERKEPEEMNKKEIIEKREKALTKAINEQLLRVGAKVDIVVTAVILAALFHFFIKGHGLVMGIIKTLLESPAGGPLGGILLILLLYDCVYLFFEKRGKDTFALGSVVVLSIGMKVIGIFIAFIYFIAKMGI